MTVQAHRPMSSTPKDAAIARLSAEVLSPLARQERPLIFRVCDEQEKSVELPASAVSLLIKILEAMAVGRGVTIIFEDTELTTVQAAKLLNVSRTFLINLLDTGAIPHRKIGTHRRIRVQDIMSYKTQIDCERETVLDKLAREAQEQDMGYGEP